MKRIGILTSGGDCPGLNAVIRGVAKGAYERLRDVQFVGIIGGYRGLIGGEYREMKVDEFAGILTLGGTILGTSRQPFKLMRTIGDDKVDKIAAMKKTYKDAKLDCLVVLGGNGTHKTAHLLSDEGLNVIGLPKTIDNDLWDTDVTFGFHSAVDIATESIDRIRTTAASHGRVMLVEIMGNKAGWLTLYAGLAGGADVILLPEIPFNIDKIIKVISKEKSGRAYSVIAVAEGAMDAGEAGLKKKERAEKRAAAGEVTATQRIAREISMKTGAECRVCMPGHLQRGGSPSAYDRILSTQFGDYAAGLIERGCFGVTVAKKGGEITENPLSEVAGKTKFVPPDHPMVEVARNMGISFGN
jgi:6-phosphofructokinase 1